MSNIRRFVAIVTSDDVTTYISIFEDKGVLVKVATSSMPYDWNGNAKSKVETLIMNLNGGTLNVNYQILHV